MFSILRMSTLQERMREAWAKRIKEHPGTRKTDLWRACGVTSGTVSFWFNGPTQKIEGEHLLRAAKFLGVDRDWLGYGTIPNKTNTKAATPINEVNYSVDHNGDAMLK